MAQALKVLGVVPASVASGDVPPCAFADAPRCDGESLDDSFEQNTRTNSNDSDRPPGAAAALSLGEPPTAVASTTFAQLAHGATYGPIEIVKVRGCARVCEGAWGWVRGWTCMSASMRRVSCARSLVGGRGGGGGGAPVDGRERAAHPRPLVIAIVGHVLVRMLLESG